MGTYLAAIHLQMIEEKHGKWGLCSLCKCNAQGIIE